MAVSIKSPHKRQGWARSGWDGVSVRGVAITMRKVGQQIALLAVSRGGSNGGSSPGDARVCFHLLIFDIARFITKKTWGHCANSA